MMGSQLAVPPILTRLLRQQFRRQLAKQTPDTIRGFQIMLLYAQCIRSIRQPSILMAVRPKMTVLKGYLLPQPLAQLDNM
ncbi:MAG: hypothetical protein B7Y20_14555 [Acidovorax sp. 16-64-162]|nr:MAG: hypothetical protein B7Y20_14555 [Acidovorax sp. 16-64-162]